MTERIYTSGEYADTLAQRCEVIRMIALTAEHVEDKEVYDLLIATANKLRDSWLSPEPRINPEFKLLTFKPRGVE